MKHDPPKPPDLAVRDGLAYALFLPDDPPTAGVVICHGAGSAKESHFEFARVCTAHGLAALAFDARGHGESEGSFDPRAVDDVLTMCAVVREHAPAVALRGSSLGGLLAIHAAARDGDVAAVVAICPATDAGFRRSLQSGRLPPFRCEVETTADWLATLDVERAVTELASTTSLLLLHAAGDEVVPVSVSETLYAAAHQPKKLIVVPGGHHRFVQHDAELQAVSVRYIARAATAAAS